MNKTFKIVPGETYEEQMKKPCTYKCIKRSCSLFGRDFKSPVLELKFIELVEDVPMRTVTVENQTYNVTKRYVQVPTSGIPLQTDGLYVEWEECKRIES